METESKIMITGSHGMVGSAVLRLLKLQDYKHLIPVSRNEVDLTNQADTMAFLKREGPEYIIVAAAKVGGILANNSYPADFLYANLMIQTNLIHSAHVIGVKKLLFLGSSCIYPKYAPQPIKEESLLGGPLEPTNEAYAIAKITGIKMCEAYSRQYGCTFISLMPCNLYGFNDNFHPDNSHVIPGLIQKFHRAKVNNEPHVVCWGTGRPKREFLFVDDLASAVVFATEHVNSTDFLNVGTGVDVTVKELAETVSKVVGFKGEILWDKSQPDGTPRKVLNIDRITSLGWHAKTSLGEGLEKTYNWFLRHQSKIRR